MNTERTPSRRAVLSGVAVSLASAAAVNAVAISAARVEPQLQAINYSEDPVRKAATECLNAMAARHGGQWKAHIDHETGFILIKPVARS